MDTKISDSFIINVKYDVEYCDIDPKNILTSALQKSYNGFGNTVFLNSDIEMIVVESKYYDETYKVIYNQSRDEYDEMDNEEDTFNFVKKCIGRITHYTYRTIHSMDKIQKSDIKILSVSNVVGK
jgi:hypothetical protein